MIFGAHSYFSPDSSLPFETGILNCGHQLVRTTDYRWDGMRRGSRVLYVWQYTLAGEGAIMLDGRVHPLPPGKAFFVRVPHEHVYYLPEESGSWEFLYFTLYGKETDRIGTEFIRRYGNVLNHGEHSPATALARDLFQEAVSGYPDDSLRSVSAAYEFLLTLFREQEQAEHSTPGSLLMEKVNDYLQKHLSEPVQVGTIAKICGCSRSHFSRQFHAAAGKTPQEYLRDLRMKHALRLLQTEHKSIKETAMDAGFEDPGYFCRVFRQKFGMTPEQFRSGKTFRSSGVPLQPSFPEEYPCGLEPSVDAVHRC